MKDVGTTISNIVSVGKTESDVYLTFVYAWNFANILEGSEEAVTKEKELRNGAQVTIPLTIEQLRVLVKDSTIA